MELNTPQGVPDLRLHVLRNARTAEHVLASGHDHSLALRNLLEADSALQALASDLRFGLGARFVAKAPSPNDNLLQSDVEAACHRG